MKPVDFCLDRPASLDEALALLAESGDEGKVLAGGQSLVPLLNFRLARPDHVIDLARIPGLGSVSVTGAWLAVDAMVRQASAEHSAVVRAACPLLAAALPHIAHPPVRARGTVCGSLAHADPAAELPAVAVALDAVFVAVSAGGRREIPAAEFFQGYLTTALRPGELLLCVRFPVAGPASGAAFCEVARRQGDFALAGVAAQLSVSDGVISDARIAVSGVAAVPFRSAAAEELLRGQPIGPALRDGTGAAGAVEAIVSAIDPPADLHATAGYRRHVTGVLVRRAVVRAAANAAAGPGNPGPAGYRRQLLPPDPGSAPCRSTRPRPESGPRRRRRQPAPDPAPRAPRPAPRARRPAPDPAPGLGALTPHPNPAPGVVMPAFSA